MIYDRGNFIDSVTSENQWKLLYAIIVAGKRADFARRAMVRFYPSIMYPDASPFETVRRLDKRKLLDAAVRISRLGNYKKTIIAFREAANSGLDLSTCTVDQLEEVHGVGPKTSRFFILWAERDDRPRVAALDVHVLRFLRDLGYEAPRATPTGRRYKKLEGHFLDECDGMELTPRRGDFAVWALYSGNVEDDPELLGDIERVKGRLQLEFS